MIVVSSRKLVNNKPASSGESPVHLQAGGAKVVVRSGKAQLVRRTGAATQLPHVQQARLSCFCRSAVKVNEQALAMANLGVKHTNKHNLLCYQAHGCADHPCRQCVCVQSCKVVQLHNLPCRHLLETQ